MTDSASIFSVGSNGFEILFAGLTGAGLAVVGIVSVASLAAAPVEPAVVVSVESPAVRSIASTSLSPGSGSSVCAPEVPEWSTAVSAVASAADTTAWNARVKGRRVYSW
jgi:hypothetical protein